VNGAESRRRRNEKETGRVCPALLFLIGLGMVHGSLSREGAQLPGQSFAISEHGTLLDLFEANGKSRFDKPVNEGFEVQYEIATKTVSASAIGTETKGLQANPGKPKLNGQSATAIVKTEDGALEITSYFILDEKAKELIIGRKFRNISTNPILLQTVRDHVAPTVVTGGQPQVTAGLLFPGKDCSVGQAPGKVICSHCKCGPSGPCTTGIICPPFNNFVPAQWLEGKGDVVLQWPDGVKLAPLQQKSGTGAAAGPLPGNEAFIVAHVSLKKPPKIQ
jgi:hypothetical protein